MKNFIKTFAIAILFVFACTYSNAQNTLGKSDDLGRIALNAYVSDQIEGIPASAKSMLKNKLNQIVTKNNLGGSSLNPRFIITPNIVVITKNMTATAPPMTAMNLEITFYIGDGLEGTIFSTESIMLKGVGTNETKAYISAIKQIRAGNSSIQSFVKNGERKIIEYYNSRCDFIIKEAHALEAQNKYEEAIYRLMTIPQVCKECYDKSLDAVGPIYQKLIDRDCKMKLQAAQGIWDASQDMEAAERAGVLLASIEPDASCFSQVKFLSNKIATKVNQIDKRKWEYILKTQAQESERINAIREIGVAYGTNQQQTIMRNIRGWW